MYRKIRVDSKTEQGKKRHRHRHRQRDSSMGAVEVAAGAGGTLSWKSRDPSWWNSAVQLSSNLSSSAKELTSTLASKMDQVPTALTGFTLPWQPVSSHKDQQQQQQPLLLDQQQPSSLSGFDHPWNVVVLMEEEKKSPELPKPVQEQLPVAPGPSLTAADLRHLSKVGESRRRTKRMPVVMASSSSSSGCNNNIDATTNRDVFSAAAASCASLHTAGLSSVSQRFLLGDDAQIDELRCNSMERLPRIENRFAKAIQLNVTQGSSSDVKYVNEASLVLSNAPSPNHSIGQALPCPSEDRSIINRQQAGSRPKTTLVHLANLEPAAIPKEDVFPGNSNTLSAIRLRKSSSISSEHGRKLANSLLFDSQGLCAVESESPIVGGSMRVPRHLDTQLESSATVPSASLPTTPRGKSKSRASRLLQRLRLGGARKGKKDSGKKAVSKPGSVITDFTCNHQHEDRHHEIMEGNNMHSGSLIQGCQCNDPTEVVKPEQKNTSRWPFNKWKWSSRSQSKVLSADPHTVDTRSSQASREFSTTTSKTAHHDDASKSFPEMIVRFSSPQLTKSASLDMGVKHRRGSSWDSDRDAASRQLLPPLAGNDIMAISNLERFSSSDPSKTSYVEVSLSSSSVCQSSKDSQEQDSGQKTEEEENTAEVFQDCESESKLVKRMSQSMGVLEWGRSQVPPLLLPEQKLTIEEVAALCSSPLKFLFKCREIELFNKFLRCQKKRITNSLHADNHDCFHIIHSGAECEVSSMVCALLMAWSMESTAPPAKANKWHLVPVVNIPRQSMHKHKDAAWLFDACGVDARALLFSDEVELEKLMKAGRIKTEEIGQDLLITKNEVGSICTLLGEQLQMEAQFLLQARYMKTLLLAGILLDTENLDFASRRDMDMATALLVGSGSLGRNGFYKQLREVESEERVSKLVTQIYGDTPLISRRSRGEDAEADHEHSDRDSCFSSVDGHHSHDQTSTSEAGTSSSLDEDSPRLQTPPAAIRSALPRSAPARFHRLPSPSGVTGSAEKNAVAQIRQAAAGYQSLPAPSYAQRSSHHAKSGSSTFSKICKKLSYNS